MIDTDKYEGHLKGPWKIDRAHYSGDVERIITESGRVLAVVEDAIAPDIALLADAPLLLQEVKRLREGISALVDKMTTTVHFYKIADETAQSYASSLKELIE